MALKLPIPKLTPQGKTRILKAHTGMHALYWLVAMFGEHAVYLTGLYGALFITTVIVASFHPEGD